MSFKATALSLLIVCASLALVKSAPSSHSLNARQYQNMTNTPNTPPTNNNTSDFIKQNGIAAQKLNSEFATIKATDPCQGPFYSTLVFYLSSQLKISARWPGGLRQFRIRTMRRRSMEVVTVLFFTA